MTSFSLVRGLLERVKGRQDGHHDGDEVIEIDVRVQCCGARQLADRDIIDRRLVQPGLVSKLSLITTEHELA